MRAAVSLSLCVLQLVFAVSGSSSFNKNWLHGFIDNRLYCYSILHSVLIVATV